MCVGNTDAPKASACQWCTGWSSQRWTVVSCRWCYQPLFLYSNNVLLLMCFSVMILLLFQIWMAKWSFHGANPCCSLLTEIETELWWTAKSKTLPLQLFRMEGTHRMLRCSKVIFLNKVNISVMVSCSLFAVFCSVPSFLDSESHLLWFGWLLACLIECWDLHPSGSLKIQALVP